jgi:ATP-dependent Clp protease ATP-binding subunit ClpC
MTRDRGRWGRPVVSPNVPYAPEANRILDHAVQESDRFRWNYVGTEHLLLGVLADEGNEGKTVLEALRVDLGSVREQVEEMTGLGPGHAGDPLPYTRRAVLVLELTAREALRAGADEIRGEHILAGLVAEGEGLAAQVLTRFGGDRPVFGQLRSMRR